MSDKPSMDTGLASILASIRETVGQLEGARPGSPDPRQDAAPEAKPGGSGTASSGPATFSRPGSPTVEDFLAELVRPYLASWLEAHLPEIVQTLVRQEVERMLNPISEE